MYGHLEKVVSEMKKGEKVIVSSYRNVKYVKKDKTIVRDYVFENASSYEDFLRGLCGVGKRKFCDKERSVVVTIGEVPSEIVTLKKI